MKQPNLAIIAINQNLVIPEVGVGEMIEEFLKSKSEKTMLAYKQDLECFAKFLGSYSINEACSYFIKLKHGEANYISIKYKNNLTDQNLSPNTINRRLASLRSIVKFGNTLGLVDWELQINNVKVEKYRDTTGPSVNSFKLMIKLASKQRNKRKPKRDVAMLHLFFDLALRRNEVASLNLDDLKGDRISILGKGRTQKEWLSIPVQTVEALAEWLKVRGTLNTEALFVRLSHNHKVERITGRGLYDVIQTLGRKVGLKLSVHSIRHTSITEGLKLAQAQGYDIESVMDFSRHKDLKVLLMYRDKIRDNQGSISNLVASSID